MIKTIAPSLSNSWLELDIALINDNGQVYNVTHSLEIYSGYSDGESWAEGSRSMETFISSVEPGTYHLEVLPTRSEQRADYYYEIQVVEDVPMWSNFFLLAIVGGFIPAIVFFRHNRFESMRWTNSNYGD